MRIMQFMPEFGLAGAETMCETLSLELARRGHRVRVASLYDYRSPITDRLEAAGLPVLFLSKRPGLDLPLLGRLRRAARDFRPDVLHTHLYLLKYVALATAGLPARGIAHTVHNMARMENNAADRAVNRLLFRGGRAVPVALSARVRDSVAETYGLDAGRVPVVWNGARLDGGAPRESYGAGRCLHIAHVGRYAEVKNHIALLRAVADLHREDPRVRLHLYGDGPLKADIARRVTELGAEGYVTDHGLTSDTRGELAKADIFVLPSLYEGMPMTIIEAMAAGLPVVASRVGGVPDMITDGLDGLLCEPESGSILAALRRLTADEALRARLGRQARESAERFSAARMAEGYERVYDNIINGKR